MVELGPGKKKGRSLGDYRIPSISRALKVESAGLSLCSGGNHDDASWERCSLRPR